MTTINIRVQPAAAAQFLPTAAHRRCDACKRLAVDICHFVRRQQTS